MCPDGRRRRRRQASDVRRRLPQRMNGATQIESRVDVAARTAPAGLRDHVNASSHVRDFGHRPAGRDGERSQRVVVVLGPRSASDRLFWVTLRRVWTRWSDMLVLVKPETVIQWHRAGFRKYWTWLARRQRTGRPSIKTGLRELILRMAAENPTLGGGSAHSRRAPNAGDRRLRAYGLKVSPSSAAKSRRARAVDPIPSQSPRHDRGDDFFTVPTASFRILYVWFAIDHARRRILHFDVTDRPAAAWVVQQLREAFPHDSAIRHLIFDRDAIFCGRVVSTAEAVGLRPTRIAYRSPWQNGVAERWVGNVRRELLDHAVVFNERHLRGCSRLRRVLPRRPYALRP